MIWRQKGTCLPDRLSLVASATALALPDRGYFLSAAALPDRGCFLSAAFFFFILKLILCLQI